MFLTSRDRSSPKLLVFAGPNGSGKSTITKSIPIVGLYVNADEIKKKTGSTDIDAAILAEKTRNILLDNRADFTFETVLSTPRNIDFIARAKAAGYQVFVAFVLTKDSEINVARVRNRVAAGGHDVPEDKIRDRYTRSLANIPKLVLIADQIRIIDNSGDEPEHICEVKGGRATIWPTKHWSKQKILALLYEP